VPTIEHYPEARQKLGQVREKSAVERQMRIEAVNAYLKGQEAGDMSRNEILKHYFKKYKDFFDPIPDNKIVEEMKSPQKLELLKELIYKHEILHEEEKNMGVKKAAWWSLTIDVNIMKIEWKEEYSVGVKEIDDQHKYFISLLNDPYNAITAGKKQEELKELFQYIADYAEKHFATEEKYFDEFNYEGAAEHKMKHQEMREEIEKIKNMDDGKEIDFYGNIVYFLKDWLDEHLQKMDQEYKECFSKHGLK